MKDFILPFLLLTLFLTGCENPMEMDHLRLASAKQPSNALTFIAMKKGFFQEEGLKLEVKSFPSGKRALYDGYLQGGFDLAITTEVPFSFLAANQTETLVFGHIYSANNTNRVISRKDAGIDSLADLKGHNIATQENSSVHYFLTRVLKSQAIATDDIQIEFMKAEKLPEALASGKIDAFSMREPYISQASDLMDGKVNIFSAPGIYNQYEVLIADKTTLQTKSRAFEKFLKALLKAQNFSYRHPDQATAILADTLDMEINKIRQSWRPNSLQIGLQQGLLVTLEGEQKWIHSSDQSIAPASVLKMLYFPIMEKVAPELISIVRNQQD